MSLALVQHLHLPEHPAADVAQLLLNDLDSIFLVGDEIDTGLHTSVSTFPQHILLQLIDIFEPA